MKKTNKTVIGFLKEWNEAVLDPETARKVNEQLARIREASKGNLTPVKTDPVDITGHLSSPCVEKSKLVFNGDSICLELNLHYSEVKITYPDSSEQKIVL